MSQRPIWSEPYVPTKGFCCPHCGYPLDGIKDVAGLVTCPERGRESHPETELLRRSAFEELLRTLGFSLPGILTCGVLLLVALGLFYSCLATLD